MIWGNSFHRTRSINGLVSFIKRHYVGLDIASLRERNVIKTVFPDNMENEMSRISQNTSQTYYAGFDPTASSLHVGNLLVLMALLHVQRSGHRPIALLGGATAIVGDPSGRVTDRKQIDSTTTEYNVECLRKQILKIFENHATCFWSKEENNMELKELTILNNADWYSTINTIEFISKVGRHFRMGTMLSRASVQSRLQCEAGMSFTEFTYQIFQAYDWLHLYKTHKCQFQIGGEDQLGNIMSGYELINKIENQNVYGIMLPILTSADGDKFGKTAGNAVWLDENQTSAFEFYQFFVRRTDAEVKAFLELFTFLPASQIDAIIQEHVKSPELRIAQIQLAQCCTRLVHGENGLRQAEMATNMLYNNDPLLLEQTKFEDIKRLLPPSAISEICYQPGLTIFQLAMETKCFPMESDAVRIIRAGGFNVNSKRVQNPSENIVPETHFMKNGLTILRVGKKKYHIVKWLK